jgi:hypothetical protein
VFTGFRLENRFRVLNGEHRINPVLYFEYENINEASRIQKEVLGHAERSNESLQDLKNETAREIEAKLILSTSWQTFAVQNMCEYKMRLPINIKTHPPATSAQEPHLRPILLPKPAPMALIQNVTIPIIMLGNNIETCKKAKLSPTDSASILVAKESMRSMVPRVGSAFSRERSLPRDSHSILPPTNTNNPNATQ